MKYDIDPNRPVYQQVPEDEFTRPMAAATGSAVYRFYANEDLLYLGITSRPRDRWYAHSRKAAWWSLATAVDVTEERMTVYQAQLAEWRGISEERPPFNIAKAVIPPAPLTDCSLIAHGVITDDSLSTPIGKGREGKGIGREVGSACIPSHLPRDPGRSLAADRATRQCMRGDSCR